MREDFAEYREYLHEGMRLEVGIPLSGGGVFRDWAQLLMARQDEVLVEISRDQLPSHVRIDVGSILDVSVWIKKDAYSCSGIVTEKLGIRALKLRLFGSFTLRERRQFFRLDLELRVRMARCRELTREDVKREWEQRLELEQMKLQGYDDVVIAAQRARFNPEARLEWQEVPPEVELGGGGIKLRLPAYVSPETLLDLEIHPPGPRPKVIQTVAEVVHVMKPRELRGVTYYPTGMRFLFLHERDRDAIFQHISVMQLDVLRSRADSRKSDRSGERSAPPSPLGTAQIVVRVFWCLLILLLTVYGFRYLLRHQQTGNEIGSSYEKALKEYRQQP